MNPVPSLELSGISKRYPGVQALDRVDLQLDQLIYDAFPLPKAS